MEKRKTRLLNREIEYAVRESRRARRLRVAVYCDASVVVTAPVYLGSRGIERFLAEHASWVLSKVDHFLQLGKTRRIGGGRREYKKYREQARNFVAKKVEEINRIYNFSFGRISIKNHRARWCFFPV